MIETNQVVKTVNGTSVRLIRPQVGQGTTNIVGYIVEPVGRTYNVPVKIEDLIMPESILKEDTKFVEKEAAKQIKLPTMPNNGIDITVATNKKEPKMAEALETKLPGVIVTLKNETQS